MYNGRNISCRALKLKNRTLLKVWSLYSHLVVQPEAALKALLDDWQQEFLCCFCTATAQNFSSPHMHNK